MTSEKATSNHTFPKREKLCSDKLIERLFQSGKSFISYPLRIVYINNTTNGVSPYPAVLISVSKRKFKHAVKRNRIKRLIREAYRLNKQPLSIDGKQLIIAFLYLNNELCSYAEIEKAMQKALNIIAEKVNSL